jgi:hypothetical protein
LSDHTVAAKSGSRSFLLRLLYIALLIAGIIPADGNWIVQYVIPFLLSYWILTCYLFFVLVLSVLLLPAIILVVMCKSAGRRNAAFKNDYELEEPVCDSVPQDPGTPESRRLQSKAAAEEFKTIIVKPFWWICVFASLLLARKDFGVINLIFLLYLTCWRDTYLFPATGKLLWGVGSRGKTGALLLRGFPIVFWPLYFAGIFFLFRDKTDILGDAFVTGALYYAFWLMLEYAYEEKQQSKMSRMLVFPIVFLSYLVTRILFYPVGILLLAIVVFWKIFIVGYNCETPQTFSIRDRYLQYFHWPFVFLMLFSGIIINPAFFAIAVEIGLIYVTLWHFVKDRIRTTNNGLLNHELLSVIPPLIVMAVYFHRSAENIRDRAGYPLFALFAVSLISLIRRETKETSRSGLQLRELTFLATAAGFLCILGMFLPSSTDHGRLRKLCGEHRIKIVYDLKLVPESNKLIFTSREKPYVGIINPATCELETIKDWQMYHPERISVFETRNRFFVGGPKGTFEFVLAPLSYEKRISSTKNVDNTSIDNDTLGVIYENSQYVTIVDASSGNDRRTINLNGSSWPYAIMYVPSRKSLFVSNWNISPNIFKIDVNGDVPAKKKFLGYMNTGMCALPKQGRLLVSRFLNHRIDILDLDTMKTLGTIPAPFGVREIECDEQKNLLFAALYFEGGVAVIDLKTKKIITRGSVGINARGLAYDARTKKVYFSTEKGIYSLDIK